MTRCGDCELVEKLRERIMSPPERQNCCPLAWTASTPSSGQEGHFRPSFEDELRDAPTQPPQPMEHRYHVDGDRFVGQALCVAFRTELKWVEAGIDVYLESLSV